MSARRRALILGAGGPAAIAWEIALIAGLARSGVDIRSADLLVGTSAGSVVAAQITSVLDIEDLYRQQVDPQRQVAELQPTVDFNQLKARIAQVKEGSGEPIESLRRLGALALATQTISESERRAVIAARLKANTWPERALLAIAVDVASGERRVFDRTSGVNLIDAVAASCAVPGVWPPVTISGHRYMDGGTYATENADLALGCERILILALTPRTPPFGVVPLDSALTVLRRSGAVVEVVRPDEATETAFASVRGDLLDPTVRERAARAGREQGGSLAPRLSAFWC
jgi:NTE family protein